MASFSTNCPFRILPAFIFVAPRFPEILGGIAYRAYQPKLPPILASTLRRTWPDDGILVLDLAILGEGLGLCMKTQVCSKSTLPDTNSKFALKMDGLKPILSFWGPAYLQGGTVSFRECIWPLVQLFAGSTQNQHMH